MCHLTGCDFFMSEYGHLARVLSSPPPSPKTRLVTDTGLIRGSVASVNPSIVEMGVDCLLYHKVILTYAKFLSTFSLWISGIYK